MGEQKYGEIGLRSSPKGKLICCVVVLLLWIAVAIVIIPSWHVLDNFEAPKRAIMSLIPSTLLLFGLLRWHHNRIAIPGAIILMMIAWFTLSNGLSSICETEIWLGWILPPLTLFTGLAVSSVNFRWMLIGLGIAGCVQAVLMLFQYFGITPFGAETITRAGAMIGTVGYHNQAASFLYICAGVLLAGLFKDKNKRAVLPILAFCLFLIAIAALTASRGPFLGFVTGGFCAVLVALPSFKRSWNKRVKIITSTTLVVISIISLPVICRIVGERMTDPAWGLSSRLCMWKVGGHMFLENPFFGNGAGSFACNYMTELAKILPAIKTHTLLQSLDFVREPHNDLLYLLAEHGLIGFLLCAGLLAACIRRILILRQRKQFASAATATFMIAYLLIHGMLSFPWHYPLTGPLAGLFLGWSLAYSQERTAIWNRRFGWGIYTAFLLIAAIVAYTAVGIAYNHLYLLKNDTPIIGNLTTPRMKSALGAKRYKNGDRDNGFRLMNAAWVASPSPMLANNLGAALTDRKQFDAAAKVYKLWADSGLLHEQALENLAITWENSGKYRKADYAYQRLQTLWPQKADWIVARRVELAMKDKRVDHLLKIAETYLSTRAADEESLSADQIHIINFTTAAYIMQGEYEKARPLLQTVLKAEPDNAMAKRNMEVIKWE